MQYSLPWNLHNIITTNMLLVYDRIKQQIITIIEYNLYYENDYNIPYFKGLFILSLREVKVSTIEYLNPSRSFSSLWRTSESVLLCNSTRVISSWLHGVKVGGKSQRSKDYKDIYREFQTLLICRLRRTAARGWLLTRLRRSVTLALDVVVTVVGLGLWREGQSGNFPVELDFRVLTWYLNYWVGIFYWHGMLL